MIQLDERHVLIVKTILKKYPYTFFVYGSRAKGTAKQFSDLDLCLKGKISVAEIGRIKGDFEESNLPIKVDLISWEAVSDAFKQQIENDLILLQENSE